MGRSFKLYSRLLKKKEERITFKIIIIRLFDQRLIVSCWYQLLQHILWTKRVLRTTDGEGINEWNVKEEIDRWMDREREEIRRADIKLIWKRRRNNLLCWKLIPVPAHEARQLTGVIVTVALCLVIATTWFID